MKLDQKSKFSIAHINSQENEIWDGKSFSIIETPKKID